ncbi:MAG: hypothetical protein I4N51_17460 [Acinetobacter sp.]|nr:hypothetical protein [Acinetobacter sp.]
MGAGLHLENEIQKHIYINMHTHQSNSNCEYYVIAFCTIFICDFEAEFIYLNQWLEISGVVIYEAGHQLHLFFLSFFVVIEFYFTLH